MRSCVFRSLVNKQQGASRRLSGCQRILETIYRYAWWLMFALFPIAWLWIKLDSQLETWYDSLQSRSLQNLSIGQKMAWVASDPRSMAAFAFSVVGLLSILAVVASLFFGDLKQRSSSRLLLFVLAACIGLSIVREWRTLAWQAKAGRIKSSLSQLQKFAHRLESEWPTREGQLSGIGSFLAYPVPKPTVLMFMSSPEIESTSIPIRAVERSFGEVLRFELGGSERGDWVELRSERNSIPTSFVDGLGQNYEIAKTRRLSDHWHLVRYQ